MTEHDLLPLEPLTAWMRGRIPGFTEIRSASKTPTGQSNPTFVLETDVGRLVVRRKPPGELMPSAHAIEREFRVMHALSRSDVPVPRAHALCEESDVLGAPFYIMEYVEGQTENDPSCPGLSTTSRGALYDNMNACLAALHRIDPVGVGLGDFGRPEGYYARQLRLWAAQYRTNETVIVAGVDGVIDWLQANVPYPQGAARIVHGDWRLDNLRFDPGSGEILAVLDWELSTLGDPLADLGTQIMQWRMPAGEEGRGLRGVDRTALNIPQDSAYIARYAERAGWTTPPDMTFPIAFALFRMAAILQGVRKRSLDGNASNPEQALKLAASIPLLIREAMDEISGGS